jgi:thioredoxin 1
VGAGARSNSPANLEADMASPNVQEFGSDNWQAEVVNSPVPVLVDFWAPWCGPCRALSPIVDRLADQFAGKVKVGKVNVDENGDLAVKYDVATIPRVLIFKGSDQPVFQHVGTISDAELAKVIQQHI